MKEQNQGIHHVTAIASDPQKNLDFYTGVLGLRLVKKTVNFDDPSTYHFYFGDAQGSPGTILTFFPWPGARRGRRDAGQATTHAFLVPSSSLGFWVDRLKAHDVAFEEPHSRFDEQVVRFLDPDGLELELVASEAADELPAWGGGPVPEETAIRGIQGVTLAQRRPEVSALFLTEVLGLRPAEEEGNRSRFLAHGSGAGQTVDIVGRSEDGQGRVAAGSIHHVAWRAKDAAEQLAWRSRILDMGGHVSPVLDRTYFQSIYFREPGGVLYEIATDGPGFVADEDLDQLGSNLKLPDWLEADRPQIEATVPEVHPWNPASDGVAR